QRGDGADHRIGKRRQDSGTRDWCAEEILRPAKTQQTRKKTPSFSSRSPPYGHSANKIRGTGQLQWPSICTLLCARVCRLEGAGSFFMGSVRNDDLASSKERGGVFYGVVAAVACANERLLGDVAPGDY